MTLWILLLLLSRFSSVWPHRRQPTRLPRPWDSPGRNTGVGCHFLPQCMKVKSESEVTQLCPTLSNPMDCSLLGSSVHGIFQARVLEWVAIALTLWIDKMKIRPKWWHKYTYTKHNDRYKADPQSSLVEQTCNRLRKKPKCLQSISKPLKQARLESFIFHCWLKTLMSSIFMCIWSKTERNNYCNERIQFNNMTCWKNGSKFRLK